jgi:F-box-like
MELIEGDTALITSLKAEQCRMENIVAQNESKAAVARACLSILEVDLAHTKEFSSYIQRTIMEATKPTNFDELDAWYALRSPTELRRHMEALDRTKVSELSTIFQTHTLAMKVKADEYVGRAFSAVEQRQQELQTATTLTIMAQMDVARIIRQIRELENSKAEKNFCLQAIWQVPDDIWRSIFEYSTGTMDKGPRIETSKIREEAQWYGALVISAVCRRWRKIAMACPRIWTKILVVKGQFKESTFPRIQHYLDLCEGMHKTLLIDGAPQCLDHEHVLLLLEMRNKWKPLTRIICILENDGHNRGTTNILQLLPPTKRIWLLRAVPDPLWRAPLDHLYHVSIPASFGTTLEELLTESVQVRWGSSPTSMIQLRSYTMDWKSVHSMWPIDLFCPFSISTLSTLRIRTTPRVTLHAFPKQHVRLANVQELHASLKYLFGEIAHRFILPVLASITILDAANVTWEQYEEFRPWLSHTKIKSMTCETMVEVGPLPKLILDLESISSLELQGATVTLVLPSLVSSARGVENTLAFTTSCGDNGALPSLKKLTIASYGGDGAPILSFLHWWKQQGQDADLRTLDVIIPADECPGLSLDVRKEIISVAQHMDRCESLSLPSFTRFTHLMEGKKCLS